METVQVEYGKSRKVFIGDQYVYKVPLNEEGYWANVVEADLSRRNQEYPSQVYIPIAPCVMTGNGVLKMRKVDVYQGDYTSLPSWVMSVDCWQVGYLDGELVAYDL